MAAMEERTTEATMRWRRKRDQQGAVPIDPVGLTGDDSVADECQMFLAGTYRDHFVLRGLEVPSWAWLNAVAHASVTDLAALEAGEGESREVGTAGEWQRAMSQLACGVLDRAGDELDALSKIQQETLIPLELTLLRTAARPDLTAAQLVALVTAALDHHRSDSADTP